MKTETKENRLLESNGWKYIGTGVWSHPKHGNKCRTDALKAGERTQDTFTRGKVDFTQQCPARYATGERSQCKKCKGHPDQHEFDETAYPSIWAEYVKLNPRKEQVIRATAYDAVYEDRENLLTALRLCLSSLEALGADNATVRIGKDAISKAMGRAK